MPMLLDKAATRDPTMKMTLATSSIGLRPKMSLTFPQDGMEAAFASRKAEPIHVYPDGLENSSEIVGSAVVMMVTSRAARKTAMHKASMITTTLPLDLPL